MAVFHVINLPPSFNGASAIVGPEEDAREIEAKVELEFHGIPVLSFNLGELSRGDQLVLKGVEGVRLLQVDHMDKDKEMLIEFDEETRTIGTIQLPGQVFLNVSLVVEPTVLNDEPAIEESGFNNEDSGSVEGPLFNNSSSISTTPPPFEAIQMQILLDFTVKEFFDDLLVKYSENGNVEGVHELLDRDGINIEARGYFEDNKQIKTEYTALLIASKNGHAQVVKMLVDKGADLSARTVEDFNNEESRSYSALELAIDNGHEDIALLSMLEDISNSTFTSFRDAMVFGVSYVEDLIKAGANIEAREKDTEMTPLLIASEQGLLDLMELFLGRGADANATDARGNTSLHYQCTISNSDSDGTARAKAAKMLIDFGADVDAKDVSGKTPLHECCFYGDQNGVLKLLLENKAEIDAVENENGETGLLIACARRHLETAVLLLLRNADRSIKGKHGKTAEEVWKEPFTDIRNRDFNNFNPNSNDDSGESAMVIDIGKLKQGAFEVDTESFEGGQPTFRVTDQSKTFRFYVYADETRKEKEGEEERVTFFFHNEKQPAYQFCRIDSVDENDTVYYGREVKGFPHIGSPNWEFDGKPQLRPGAKYFQSKFEGQPASLLPGVMYKDAAEEFETNFISYVYDDSAFEYAKYRRSGPSEHLTGFHGQDVPDRIKERVEQLEKMSVEAQRILTGFIIDNGRGNDRTESGYKLDGHFGGNRNGDKIDSNYDNEIWADGTNLKFAVDYTFPEDLRIQREDVVAAVEIACWIWMKSGFAVTMEVVGLGESPTHVVTYGGYDPAKSADADFPTTRRYPKHVTFYEKGLDNDIDIKMLLGRTTHELGHSLGLYHEFDKDTIHIGKIDNRLSIMSYERYRYATELDLKSLYKLYLLKHGYSIPDTHVKILRITPDERVNRNGDQVGPRDTASNRHADNNREDVDKEDEDGSGNIIAPPESHSDDKASLPNDKRDPDRNNDGNRNEDGGRTLTEADRTSLLQKPIITEIYDTLAGLFTVADDQKFLMEFPGRVLNEDTFAYNTDSVNSGILKPQPVMEAEFHLSNDLFNESSSTGLVGGPNGKKLSSSYTAILNNLVPKLNMERIIEDKNELRKWLTKVVTDTVAGEKFTGTRMALYQKLLDRYSDKKREQMQIRYEKLQEALAADAMAADNSEAGLANYTRWLARAGEGQKVVLESFWNDLVVRGYYHEVQSFLGYIDIGSTAEALNEAKGNMRASRMSSLDMSETIYPVYFQPTDWFKSLSTDFQPQDLTMDPSFIRKKLFAKKKELIGVRGQLELLLAVSAAAGDPKVLEEQVGFAQAKLDNAHENTLKVLSENVFEAAKLAYKIYQKKQGSEGNDMEQVGEFFKDSEAQETFKELNDGDDWVGEEIDKFKQYNANTIEAQTELKTASRKLVTSMERHARAASSESKNSRMLLEQRMTSISLEIESLYMQASSLPAAKLPGVLTATGGEASEEEKSAFMPKNSVGPYMDVFISAESGTTVSNTENAATATASQANVSLLFGSYSGENESSASAFQNSLKEKTMSFDIGFRATKVTIRRGGWFRPELFEGSEELMRLTDMTFKKMLPSYPIAFIIVKDVTIKVHVDIKDTETANTYMQNRSSSSGGFLCFSASSSGSSSRQSESFYSSSSSTGIEIKIPGPQILFWIMQKTPTDKSTVYPTTQSALSDKMLEVLQQKLPTQGEVPEEEE